MFDVVEVKSANTNFLKKIRNILSIPVVSGVILFFALSALGIMGLYFSAGTYKLPLFFYQLQQPKLVLLNTLPFVLVGFLAWFIFNRTWLGFLASGLLCLSYSFVNYWKLVSRDEPLFAEDLSLAKEAMQMSDKYIAVTWQMYLAIFLVFLGTVIFAFLVKGKIKKGSIRIGFAGLLLVSCIPLYTKVYSSYEIYDSFVVWDELNKWFENNKYISRGGIYPFLYSIQSAVVKPPQGYDKVQAKQILDSYETYEIPEDKKVNFMFVMYEAFSDLSKYTDKITSADPYESFHRLQEESYHGELVTNIFAGGTINTERCVLTGFSSLTSFRNPVWSYARYFANQGYSVNGSHAGFQAFYNRVNINRNLGIDNYKFIENHFYELVDGIPMDDVFLPEITRLFEEEIEGGNKVLSYNVTYQNHGPYNTRMDSDAKEYVPLEENMNSEDYGIINNYLKGIEETGNYMYEMADKFRDSEEPIILVFFGDHKPWLGEYSSTYTALGIDIFEETERSFYNHYNTEYLIWANEAAKEILNNDFVGEGEKISPCFLMNVLFEQCGYGGPSFMGLSREVMEVLPVITTNDRFMQDGELVSREDISDENVQLINRMNIVQYYLSKDYYKEK